MRMGTVALVGAGPGDVDLLTVAALKAIQSAEVILYDALISSEMRALFSHKARIVYVGKRCGQHALRQEQINEHLVSYALQGFRVVRLKGGDPLIFGRGGEELAALRAAAIPYRVIPGISAFNGLAAAYALPLTLRTGSNEFRAIQGHFLREDPSYWRELAHYDGTLVIYMGLAQLPDIAARLRRFGAPFDRPIAVIETDDAGHSHVTRSQLGLVQSLGFERKTQGPGLVYIGSNVALMDMAPSQTKEFVHDVAFAHFS